MQPLIRTSIFCLLLGTVTCFPNQADADHSSWYQNLQRQIDQLQRAAPQGHHQHVTYDRHHRDWRHLTSARLHRRHDALVLRVRQDVTAVKFSNQGGSTTIRSIWAVTPKGLYIPLQEARRKLRSGETTVYHLPSDRRIRTIVVETRTPRRHQYETVLSVSYRTRAAHQHQPRYSRSDPYGDSWTHVTRVPENNSRRWKKNRSK